MALKFNRALEVVKIHSLTHSLLRVTSCGSYSALHVDRSSAAAHASSAESPESRTIWLIHVVRGLPAGRDKNEHAKFVIKLSAAVHELSTVH